MDAELEVDSDWISGLVLLLFNAIFGYAFCSRSAPESEEAEDEAETSGTSKKDVKSFKQLSAEIRSEREKLQKISAKLTRYEEKIQKSTPSEFIINPAKNDSSPSRYY